MWRAPAAAANAPAAAANGPAATGGAGLATAAATLGCALALVVVASAGAAAAAGAVSAAGSAAAPITVRVSLTPSSVSFGDPALGEVDVTVDRRLVDPRAVHASIGVAPLTELEPARVSRVAAGGLTVLRYRLVAGCVGEDCVPAGRSRTVTLTPVRVEARLRDGSTAVVTQPWPKVTVAGRASAAAAYADTPPFQREVGLPGPSFQVSPAHAAVWLEVAAGLLGLAAFLAGAFAVRSFRRERRQARSHLGELGRALELARASTLRPAADRRRALSLLARVLERADATAAGAAERLAWSPAAPAPDEITALVDTVEQGQSEP